MDCSLTSTFRFFLKTSALWIVYVMYEDSLLSSRRSFNCSIARHHPIYWVFLWVIVAWKGRWTRNIYRGFSRKILFCKSWTVDNNKLERIYKKWYSVSFRGFQSLFIKLINILKIRLLNITLQHSLMFLYFNAWFVLAVCVRSDNSHFHDNLTVV